MLRSRIKLWLTTGLAAATLAVGGVMGISAAAPSHNDNNDNNGNKNGKVTICHATGSQTNPYVTITADINGVVNGHAHHQDQNDIIPPFTYNDHGTTASFPGLNWTVSGQATYNNGCVPVTSTPPTTPPTTTTTPPPTGGRGAGEVATTTTLTTNAAASTTQPATTSAPQVQAPAGSVNAGVGGGPASVNTAAAIGFGGSLATLLVGAVWLNRRFILRH